MTKPNSVEARPELVFRRLESRNYRGDFGCMFRLLKDDQDYQALKKFVLEEIKCTRSNCEDWSTCLGDNCGGKHFKEDK